MLTKEHVSLQLQKYKDEHNLSLEKMAKRLEIPKSSLYEYIKGRKNLRSDTIDLIAGKIGITLPEMFSEPSHSYERAVRMLQAAEMLGGLPEAQQEQAVQLFLAMVSLFT